MEKGRASITVDDGIWENSLETPFSCSQPQAAKSPTVRLFEEEKQTEKIPDGFSFRIGPY